MGDQQRISQLLKRRKDPAADLDSRKRLASESAGVAGSAGEAHISATPVASSTPVKATVLPEHYRLLAAQFDALDVVLTLFQGRRERFLFDKIRPEVGNITKR